MTTEDKLRHGLDFLAEVARKSANWERGDGTPMHADAQAVLDHIAALEAERDAAIRRAVAAEKDAAKWRAWRPFVERAVRTVDEWDGPMRHPFFALVDECRKNCDAALAQQPSGDKEG